MDVVALACLAATAALSVVAAYRDVVSFTLPNWLTLTVAALFAPFVVVMYLSGSLSLATIGTAFAVAAGIFAAGVALFALGTIGGGDVKYLAAASLWAWPVGLLQFLLITSLAGALVAALYLVLPRLASMGAGPTSSSAKPSKLARPMPYGVAISIGLAYVIALWFLRISA
jgi:prepilin peptidase CpaA